MHGDHRADVRARDAVTVVDMAALWPDPLASGLQRATPLGRTGGADSLRPHRPLTPLPGEISSLTDARHHPPARHPRRRSRRRARRPRRPAPALRPRAAARRARRGRLGRPDRRRPVARRTPAAGDGRATGLRVEPAPRARAGPRAPHPVRPPRQRRPGLRRAVRRRGRRRVALRAVAARSRTRPTRTPRRTPSSGRLRCGAEPRWPSSRSSRGPRRRPRGSRSCAWSPASGWSTRRSAPDERPRPSSPPRRWSATSRCARRVGACSRWASTSADGRATRWPRCAGPAGRSRHELGVDPGPRLAALERDVLAQTVAPIAPAGSRHSRRGAGAAAPPRASPAPTAASSGASANSPRSARPRTMRVQGNPRSRSSPARPVAGSRRCSDGSATSCSPTAGGSASAAAPRTRADRPRARGPRRCGTSPASVTRARSPRRSSRCWAIACSALRRLGRARTALPPAPRGARLARYARRPPARRVPRRRAPRRRRDAHAAVEPARPGPAEPGAVRARVPSRDRHRESGRTARHSRAVLADAAAAAGSGRRRGRRAGRDGDRCAARPGGGVRARRAHRRQPVLPEGERAAASLRGRAGGDVPGARGCRRCPTPPARAAAGGVGVGPAPGRGDRAHGGRLAARPCCRGRRGGRAGRARDRPGERPAARARRGYRPLLAPARARDALLRHLAAAPGALARAGRGRRRRAVPERSDRARAPLGELGHRRDRSRGDPPMHRGSRTRPRPVRLRHRGRPLLRGATLHGPAPGARPG